MASTIDTDPTKQSIIRIEKEKPLPTAPVSTLVVWYAHGKVEPANQRAGIVTQILEPGKLNITIFPVNGVTSHQRGVHYMDDPIHLNRANTTTVKCGSWGYPDGTQPDLVHFKPYQDRCKKRIKALKIQLKEQENHNQKLQDAATEAVTS